MFCSLLVKILRPLREVTLLRSGWDEVEFPSRNRGRGHLRLRVPESPMERRWGNVPTAAVCSELWKVPQKPWSLFHAASRLVRAWRWKLIQSRQFERLQTERTPWLACRGIQVLKDGLAWIRHQRAVRNEMFLRKMIHSFCFFFSLSGFLFVSSPSSCRLWWRKPSFRRTRSSRWSARPGWGFKTMLWRISCWGSTQIKTCLSASQLSLVSKVSRRQRVDMNLLFLNIKVRRAQLLSDSLDEVRTQTQRWHSWLLSWLWESSGVSGLVFIEE